MVVPDLRYTVLSAGDLTNLMTWNSITGYNIIIRISNICEQNVGTCLQMCCTC